MKLPPVTIANRSSFLIVNGDCRNVNKNSILENSKIITRRLRLTLLLNGCYTGQWANFSLQTERETMSFHIRPFMPGDYAALSAISHAIHPDYAATEDEMRYW